MILRFIQDIGHVTYRLLVSCGSVVDFAARAVFAALTPPFFLRNTVAQLLEIGYFSLPVVGLTTIFSGMVLALQSYSGFSSQFAEQTLPTLIVLAITRELAPVLSGLMVAGRVGAAMAANIGAMRVSEQIDALETMNVSPLRYLVAPRLLAAVVTLPLLVLVGDLLGILGGYAVGAYRLDLNPELFLANAYEALDRIGVVSGLVKAAVFGFLIALIGCYFGYHSEGGADGVGRATTNAVVYASIMILVANYFVTAIFFGQ